MKFRYICAHYLCLILLSHCVHKVSFTSLFRLKLAINDSDWFFLLLLNLLFFLSLILLIIFPFLAFLAFFTSSEKFPSFFLLYLRFLYSWKLLALQFNLSLIDLLCLGSVTFSVALFEDLTHKTDNLLNTVYD